MRRRSLGRAIRLRLQKYKHVIDSSVDNADLHTATTTVLIAAGQDNPVLANTTDVSARSRIMSLYLETTYAIALAAAVPQNRLHLILFFNPQNSIGNPNPLTLGSASQKQYVFKQWTQNLNYGIGCTTVRQIIKIPAKYQRYMNTDQLKLAIRSETIAGANESIVVKAIYKEIRG